MRSYTIVYIYILVIFFSNRYEWETSQPTFVAQFRWEDGAKTSWRLLRIQCLGVKEIRIGFPNRLNIDGLEVMGLRTRIAPAGETCFLLLC